MILSYRDLYTGERQRINAQVTTDHPASSYGMPVIVLEDGESLDPSSWLLLAYQVEYIGDPAELEALRRALAPFAIV